jgi:hypothetical protein
MGFMGTLGFKRARTEARLRPTLIVPAEDACGASEGEASDTSG